MEVRIPKASGNERNDQPQWISENQGHSNMPTSYTSSSNSIFESTYIFKTGAASVHRFEPLQQYTAAAVNPTMAALSPAHTGKKGIPCPVCGKCFPCRSQLEIHIRSHTGVKPFKCQQCGKSFAHKSNMKAHQIIHLKPLWSCPASGNSHAYWVLSMWDIVVIKRLLWPFVRPVYHVLFVWWILFLMKPNNFGEKPCFTLSFDFRWFKDGWCWLMLFLFSNDLCLTEMCSWMMSWYFTDQICSCFEICHLKLHWIEVSKWHYTVSTVKCSLILTQWNVHWYWSNVNKNWLHLPVYGTSYYISWWEKCDFYFTVWTIGYVMLPLVRSLWKRFNCG